MKMKVGIFTDSTYDLILYFSSQAAHFGRVARDGRLMERCDLFVREYENSRCECACRRLLSIALDHCS